MGGFDYLEYAVGINMNQEDWESRVLCLNESTLFISLSRGWMGGERSETPPGATGTQFSRTRRLLKKLTVENVHSKSRLHFTLHDFTLLHMTI